MNDYALNLESKTDLVKTFYNGLNNNTKWKLKSLRDQIYERYAQPNACKLTIEDYNNLNKLLNLNNYSTSELDCDLVRPALPMFTEKTKRCKSFGQYLLQFGPEVYKKFHEKSVQKWKKRNKGIDKKQSTSNTVAQTAIQQLEKKNNKGVKWLINSAALISLNSYYKANCLDIFDDYNTFFDAYMEFHKDINTDGKNTLVSQTNNEECDFFERLKLNLKT